MEEHPGKMSLGDRLAERIDYHLHALGELERLVQISYGAFTFRIQSLIDAPGPIFLDYAKRWLPDGNPVIGKHEYSVEELVKELDRLATFELPLTTVYHLVSRTEVVFGDLTKIILDTHPQKIPSKRQMPIAEAFSAQTLEELRSVAIDTFCNELAYKSPQDYAEAVSNIFSFQLAELPAYPRYVEIKATRDIHIHNAGIANSTYERKAGSHARCKSGDYLPIIPRYYSSSFEACVNLALELRAALLTNFPTVNYNSPPPAELGEQD